MTLAHPIEQAIEEQQSVLDRLTAALSPMEAVYRHEQQQRESRIQPLVGEETINAATWLALEACTDQLLTAHPRGGRPVGLLAEALPRVLAAAGRGVRQRSLYSHTMRSHGPTLAYAEQVTGVGAEVRTVGIAFEQLIVCDRAIAFIPVHTPKGSHAHALAIREPGLIDYIIHTFEGLWEQAEPVTFKTSQTRPPRLTSEIQRTILKLMVNGHTDEAISKRLGLSARSIGTHIKRAAELFGSRSRAELGYNLAKAGALDIGCPLTTGPRVDAPVLSGS
ncbi:LuxR C-terminal-related transcriptional regulator [Streptomyces rimosus]|uniref:helix-turn-helix transcriptional regulator n=1 Tax=Streptomyces rimosus TaxID=1927 RepID=UPI000AF1DFF3|nr:LuxR C-terminal-related transcriptional regulator [Streptomyces rimosus]